MSKRLKCAICGELIWRGGSGDWFHSRTDSYSHRALPPDPREPLTDEHDDKWAADFARGFDSMNDHSPECYCMVCTDDNYDPLVGD